MRTWLRSSPAVLAAAVVMLGAVASASPAAGGGRVDPNDVSNPPLKCGDTSTDLGSYPNRGITLPRIPLPAAEEHPAVDFTSADIPTLRARAAAGEPDPHGLYQRDWNKVLADVRSGGTGRSSPDDIASRRAKANAFAYVITGDPAYRTTAVEALRQAFAVMEDDDLTIAAQVTTYAQAYDYLAGSLTPGDTDDLAIRAAVKKGARWLADWLNHDNPHGSNPRPHNHRAKAALGLGLWSLVFSADPDAGGWLGLSEDQLNSVYQYLFTRDGIYLDGYGYYWDFQLFQALPFFYAAKHLTGVDAFPAMRPVFAWMVRDSAPQGWLMNIEDSWIKLTWTAMAAPEYLNTPTSLSTSAPLGEVLQWRFFQQDWNAVQYPDLNGNSWTGAFNQVYLWPDELAHIDQRIPEVQPDASRFDFYAGGGNNTVMRSDWNYGDPKTRWVMFYGAPQSNNHDHCDVMEVLLNAENTVMLNDDGYGPKRFSGRADWFPSAGHNVITMDGAGSNDVFANTVNVAGASTDYAEKLAYYDQQTPGVAGTKSWRRGVLFAGHDYLVIADSLHSPQPQTWDAYLHARGTLRRDGQAATWTTPDNIFGASANLYAYVLPAAASISTRTGQDNLYGSQATPPATETNSSLKIERTGADAQFLTIAVPRAPQAAAPSVTDLSPAGGAVLAAAISYDGHVDTVVTQQRIGRATAGQVTTDARLAWVRTVAGTVTGWELTGGTALRVNRTEWLRSSTPLTATADLTGPTPVVTLRAAAHGSYTVEVRGAHPAATFDGHQICGTVNGDTTTYRLTGSGQLRWASSH